MLFEKREKSFDEKWSDEMEKKQKYKNNQEFLLEYRWIETIRQLIFKHNDLIMYDESKETLIKNFEDLKARIECILDYDTLKKKKHIFKLKKSYKKRCQNYYEFNEKVNQKKIENRL